MQDCLALEMPSELLKKFPLFHLNWLTPHMQVALFAALTVRYARIEVLKDISSHAMLGIVNAKRVL